MFKTTRLIAIAAIAAIPVGAIVSTAGAQAPYAPYAPQATPAPTPTPTPAPSATPVPPAQVITQVEQAVKKASAKIRLTSVLKSTKTTKISIPVPSAGVYDVAIQYKFGKKYKTIARGAIATTKAGSTANVSLKRNLSGKKLYSSLKRSHATTTKVKFVLSYEVAGNRILTSAILKVKR